MRQRFTSIDLFSGAGGLSLGLSQAGFDPVAAVEISKDASETYKHKFQGSQVFSCDIKDIGFKKFRGSVDLVAGGPPCQPFSVAGHQKSFNDPRDMIPEFIRVISEVQPKAFLMENVAGLDSSRHREYLSRALQAFGKLGYKVEQRIHNASEHGVPQDRRRLIVVGTQKEGFKFPKASHGPHGRYKFVSAGESLKNAPEDDPNNAIVTYAKKPVLRLSPFAGMLVNGGGRPIDLAGPSQTIPASAGGNRTHIVDDTGILMAYHHDLMHGSKPRAGIVEGVRRLTIRESACLQSFPNDFNFLGSKSSQYRQIGNAVPPKLAKSIGQKLHSFLVQ